MFELPWPARVYILAIAGLALLASLRALATPVDTWTFTVTVVLFVFVESVSIIRVSRGMLVSAGFPVTLASAIMLGPWWAAVVGLTGAVNYHPGGLPLVKRLFNGCQLALSVLLCGLVYEAMGGARDLTVDHFPEILLAVLSAAAVYSVANALLVTGVLVAAEGLSPKDAWQRTAMPIVSYLGYGMFGLLMAVLWNTPVNALAAVLVLLPLMVARWMFAQYVNERAAYDRTVRTLVQAVETKDYYTRGHSERVSRGSVMIARKLRMSSERVELLRFAGILHDLGKLGVPTRVLQKSGALTPDEFAAIQLHPVRGVEMVRDIRFLREAYDGIMHHHERMDGKGYPLGLSSYEIPEFARVIAVADAFDSMTSTRSYRAARGVADALDELERCTGTHFDPAMVSAFVAAVAEDGWTSAEAPSAPLEPGAQITRYDHDDPATALPVIGRDDE